MTLLRSIIAEFFGLFVDDGALAVQVLALVAAITLAVRLLGLPPLAAAGFLLIGCLAILAVSLGRAGRR